MTDEDKIAVPRHKNAPMYGAWVETTVSCQVCAHLRALRVERSFTQYQCGCQQCADYLEWTRDLKHKSACACFVRCTREEFERMADVWSASAYALARFFAWCRARARGETQSAEECGIPLVNISRDGECPVLRCAPFLVKDVTEENPNVGDNDGVRVLGMYQEV